MVRLLIDSEQSWRNFYVIIARERSPLGDAHYSVVRQLEAKSPYLIPQLSRELEQVWISFFIWCRHAESWFEEER